MSRSADQGGKAQEPVKQEYMKPAYRYERVFVTSALSCGKIIPTEANCAHNTKVS